MSVIDKYKTPIEFSETLYCNDIIHMIKQFYKWLWGEFCGRKDFSNIAEYTKWHKFHKYKNRFINCYEIVRLKAIK